MPLPSSTTTEKPWRGGKLRSSSKLSTAVRVFQLVAEDTVEDRVLKVQEKKDALIAQAFSGNRNAPKGREKIDARMHDIADIFGL
ncbi:hypothetical protein JCM1841_002066 [Sporobolomyces salmonicolor]